MNEFVPGKSISRKKVVWTGGITRKKRVEKVVRGKAGFAALAEGLRDFAHKETVSDLAGLDGAFVGQRERDNWATIGD
jgi:hypothetical protein